ncbi:unnamed protein product, partial [Closterium sp. NIES-65]
MFFQLSLSLLFFPIPFTSKILPAPLPPFSSASHSATLAALAFPLPGPQEHSPHSLIPSSTTRSTPLSSPPVPHSLSRATYACPHPPPANTRPFLTLPSPSPTPSHVS